MPFSPSRKSRVAAVAVPAFAVAALAGACTSSCITPSAGALNPPATVAPTGTPLGAPAVSPSASPLVSPPVSLAPAVSTSPTPAVSGESVEAVATGPLLPGGGRLIFPRYRVIAYYGNGQSSALGVLGHFPPDDAATRIAAVARTWATPSRPTLPAMELIVSIADGSAGPDGHFSHDTADAVIQRYLAAVRRHHQLLVLDIQPGRQDFLGVVKRYEKFLIQPDVGIALDPEWRMGPGDVPGQVIGQVDATEINRVTAYVAALTAEHNLPQKIVMVHNFTASMVTHPALVVPRAGLAIVWHVDGFGSWPAKVKVYQELHKKPPFFNGFKLFYTLDRPLATPSVVRKLTPSPDFISYQ